MCWSSQVSLLSGLFDATAVVILYLRNRGRDRCYAAILVPIMCQEICQMVLWMMGAPMSTQCGPVNKLFSFSALLFSQLVPPMALLIGRTRQQYCSLLVWIGWALYLLQALVVWISVFLSNLLCVRVGPNHHQVWISDQGVFFVGGDVLYKSTILTYLLAATTGVISLELPSTEAICFIGLGVVTFFANFELYSETLEASSIWCWSAFLLGLYSLLRPLPKQKIT